MTKRVLVPVDGSPQSSAALAFAAAEWPDASFTLLHVIDPALASGAGRGVIPSGSEEWYQGAKSRAEALFEEARTVVGEDVAVATRTEVGRPARTIVEVAGEGTFDHVVMGSHGREGVSRILLGSTAEDIVRKSPIPVTIVRDRPDAIAGDAGEEGSEREGAPEGEDAAESGTARSRDGGEVTSENG